MQLIYGRLCVLFELRSCYWSHFR